MRLERRGPNTASTCRRTRSPPSRPCATAGRISNPREGHLLYARALADAGRTEEALQEFQEVSQYFSGAEARVRYGMLLDQLGRVNEAKVMFTELLIQMKRAPKHVRKMQAEWLAIAEKYLAA